MAKRNGTDGSLLGSLPWTLVALGIAVLPHLPYLPIWITGIFLGCAVARLVIEQRRWRLPGTLSRLFLAVLSFVGVLATYETISGVGPGSALLTVMAALKLLETRRRRDQFVLLFLSIFLIMSSLLREQHVWSLPYMVAGTIVTMTAWLQMSIGAAGGTRHAFGRSLRLIALATPLMLAMWVFFPRIATPFWAVPIDTSSGVTGLSNEMSPGDISSLSASDAVAFRVRFDGPAPAPRLRYWRGLVLTRFSGRTWTGNDPTFGGRGERPVDYLGEPVRYDITMEPTRQHWVFALDMPSDWSLDNTYMGWQQQLQRSHPIDQRVVYSAVSYPRFRVETDLPPFLAERYSRLPDAGNPETRALAAAMRREADSNEAYIDDVMRLFNEQDFYYTLQPPALGANSVDAFLFRSRRGFCEHYASAFAVLMRAAGLPARVVVGYQGGELNPMGDYLIVRQSDAHAWAEVWLEGRGWVRYDPTSAVAPERIESGMASARLSDSGLAWGFSVRTALLHRLTLAWDMINAKWNEWILAYGPENQRSFMQWLGMDDPDVRKMLLTLIAVLALLLGGVALWLTLKFRPPSNDRARRAFDRFARKAGLAPHTGEAPLDYATRLAAAFPAIENETSRIVSLYLDARYGEPCDDAVERLDRAVGGFRRPRAA